MNTYIYDKTDKGRLEIATRKYHVPAKLRTLLVMIDGRHSLESLMPNFAALGLSEGNVNQLLSEEFIALVGGVPAAIAPPPEAPGARGRRSRRARACWRATPRNRANSIAPKQRPMASPTRSTTPCVSGRSTSSSTRP